MANEHQAELQRVRGGAHGPAPGKVMIRLRIECGAADAVVVLERTKEVMVAVLSKLERNEWPSIDEWRVLLPDWFVAACADERTAEEAARWLEWWRSLSPDEQARATEREPWALDDWLHWFRPGPDARQWSWWNAEIRTPADFTIDLAANSWPTAHGALDWVLRAAGGTRIKEETASP